MAALKGTIGALAPFSYLFFNISLIPFLLQKHFKFDIKMCFLALNALKRRRGEKVFFFSLNSQSKSMFYDRLDRLSKWVFSTSSSDQQIRNFSIFCKKIVFKT